MTFRWPSPWSLSYWLARGFNAAMHVRNALIRPAFVMYYLTFLLPEAQKLLEDCGFVVQIQSLGLTGPWASLRLVCATKLPSA